MKGNQICSRLQLIHNSFTDLTAGRLTDGTGSSEGPEVLNGAHHSWLGEVKLNKKLSCQPLGPSTAREIIKISDSS